MMAEFNVIFEFALFVNTLLLFQRSEAVPMEESNPQISSPINIKDEPIDEGYDAALLPQSSIRQIKEELEHQEVGVERREKSYHYVDW